MVLPKNGPISTSKEVRPLNTIKVISFLSTLKM